MNTKQTCFVIKKKHYDLQYIIEYKKMPTNMITISELLYKTETKKENKKTIIKNKYIVFKCPYP